MSWFNRKKEKSALLLDSINQHIRSLSLAAIEQRRVHIIHQALFDSDDAVIALFKQTSLVGEKLHAKSKSSMTELIERGLKETASEFCADSSKDILRSLIRFSSEKISQGCPRWLDSNKHLQWSQFTCDQFEEYTTLAFLIKRYYSLDEHIMFSYPSYFKTEFDTLKDFRLKTLVQTCMSLVDLKGGGRFTGTGFEDGAFKATTNSQFIESCWHIHIKRFSEYAIFRTMIDDNDKELSKVFRSDETFSREIPILLRS